LFFAEAHDSRWRATQSGRALPDAAAFGWANAYPLARGPARLHFAGGPQRSLALALQAFAWLVLVLVLVGGRWRRFRRGDPDPAALAAGAAPPAIEERALVGTIGAAP
jgi:hypothetical protein